MKSLYRFIGRMCFFVCIPLILLLLRPHSRRVRIIVVNDKNQILLVRGWFSHQRWSLPGGGMKAGESEAAAAVRELHEETGLRILQDQLSFVLHTKSGETITYQAAVFKVRVSDPQLDLLKGIHRYEILDCQWFDLTELPSNRSKLIDKVAKQGQAVVK